MYAKVEKTKENKSRAVANSVTQNKSGVMQGFGFVNNRPEVIVQRKLQEMANNSPQIQNATIPYNNLLASTLQVIDRMPAIQRRAANTRELTGTTENGTAPIFDSKVNTGKQFDKTIRVKNHDAFEVIKAYQKAITPIGNSFAAVHYTDAGNAKFPNMVGAMPVVTPPAGILTYLMTQVLGPTPVQGWLDVPTPKAMQKLFPAEWSWSKVKEMLQMWYGSGRAALLDNNSIGLVDPFIVRMVFESEQRGQNNWEVDTQFADSAKGYVVRVHDGKNDITGTIVTAGDFAAETGNPTATSTDLVYSSTHVPGGVASVGTRVGNLHEHQGGDTRGGQHDALDAFTLIGAEGARFRPVAELGSSATMGANFYTKPGKGFKGAHNVNLPWLYANWGLHFRSGYDITKETMATVVNANGMAINQKPAKPNYNLTSGVMDK